MAPASRGRTTKRAMLSAGPRGSVIKSHTILMACGQRQKERRDYFDGAAVCLGRTLGYLLDGLPFVIAAKIVSVYRAQPLSQQRRAASAEHLHGEEVPERDRPAER